MSIPKNIFQIWITTTGKKMPDTWKEAQRSVIKNNSNWNYYLIDYKHSVSIIKKNFPDFLPYFINFRYDVQRADAIRYILLYLYGGIYLDLDFVAVKSFNSVKLNEGKEIGFLKSFYVDQVTNAFIVSKPRSKFWLYCISQMKKKKPIWAITRHLEVFHTTGPSMVNSVADAFKNNIQVLENIKKSCDSCNLQSCSITSTEDYIIYPIEGKSWNSWDSDIMNFCYCNRYVIFFIIVGIMVYFFVTKK